MPLNSASSATACVSHHDYDRTHLEKIQRILEEKRNLEKTTLVTISLQRLKKKKKDLLKANITTISDRSNKEFLEFQLCSQNQLSFLKILVNIFTSGMKLALDIRRNLQWKILSVEINQCQGQRDKYVFYPLLTHKVWSQDDQWTTELQPSCWQDCCVQIFVFSYFIFQMAPDQTTKVDVFLHSKQQRLGT